MAAGSLPQDRPWLVLVTGEPGSGKSQLARQLATTLRLPCLSRDDVRGGLQATSGIWTNQVRGPAEREVARETFFRIVEQVAGAGVSAVLDVIVFRDQPEDLVRLEALAHCLVVLTTCADAEARAIERDRADPLLNRPSVLDALGHPSVEGHLVDGQRAIVRDRTRTEFDLPLLPVRTDDGYEPPSADIVDWIIEQSRR